MSRIAVLLISLKLTLKSDTMKTSKVTVPRSILVLFLVVSILIQPLLATTFAYAAEDLTPDETLISRTVESRDNSSRSNGNPEISSGSSDVVSSTLDESREILPRNEESREVNVASDPTANQAVDPREDKSRTNTGGGGGGGSSLHVVEPRDESSRTPEVPGNTPPVITLLGLTHFTINLNEVFVDPGATAFDKEDGDLTSQITVTGTVNTSVVGTSTLQYRVVDSGGLVASKIRTVYVLPEMYLPQMPACNGNFGRATFILHNTGTTTEFYTRGFHYDNTPSHYLGFVSPDLWPGDSLDWHWVKPRTPGNYIEWDLGTLTENLRVYPVQDHGPYPEEFHQFRVEVSSDRTIWEDAASTALYVDDINNIRTHDGVKDYISSSESPFRYVRIFSTQTVPGAHYEIDAVQACGSFMPGFSVNSSSGETSEDGDTFLLTITINTRPTAPVTVVLSSSDTTEGTISPETLTFSGDVRTHTVTVTGIDDNIVDGDVEYGISSSSVVSQDPVYNGLSVPTVSMVNFDNDTAPSGGGGGGSGGGSGGGGSSGGQRIFFGSTAIPEVLGASTEFPSCNYLNSYIRRGWDNDKDQVMRLQLFLRGVEGFSNVELTGVYDDATFNAVSAFQEKYKADILDPWGINGSTGYVYILTKKKINEIVCEREFGLTPGQTKEIRDSFLALRTIGEQTLSQSGGVESESVPVALGEISASSTVNETVLAGVTGEDTSGGANRGALRNLAAAIFSIPDNRSELLQSLYYLFFILLAIYILATIVVNVQDTSALSRREFWSRKITYIIIGLVLALIGVIWFKALSVVIPLLVLLIITATLLLWNTNRRDVSTVFADSSDNSSGPGPNFIMVSSPPAEGVQAGAQAKN